MPLRISQWQKMSKKRNSETKKEIRLALVPKPTCICEQCLMLASRGFDFKKEFDTHGSIKSTCKCKFMPGIKNETKIDGYDPEECANKCKEVKRIKNELGSDLGRLDDEQKERIINSIYEAESKGITFSRVDDSEPIKIDYTNRPKDSFGVFKKELDGIDKYDENNFEFKGNEWRDLFAHYVLSNHGFEVRIRRGSAVGIDGKIIQGLTLVDVDLNGILYEIKSVTGTNIGRIIETRMKEVVKRNFRNPYDDATMLRYDYDPVPRMVFNMMYCEADEMDALWHIPRRMGENTVEDVLILLKNGNVYRFTKK